MRKILVVCIIYLLIIISYSGCVEEVSHIDIKTIYVDDDGGQNYTNIQDAINSAEDGTIIYVYSGTYVEELHISKPIKLRGENKEKTILLRPEDENGSSGDLIQIFADEVEISGFTLKNIKYRFSVGCGISIYSDNNVISNNNFISADFADILLDGAKANVIVNNNFTSNGILIRLSCTPFPKYWNTHTIENNYINGKPIIYIKNNHDGDIVSSNYGQVILANCNNYKIENLNLENAYCGIQLGYSSYNTIVNSTIDNMNQIGVGIRLQYSKFNSINENKVHNCWEGISFDDYSNNNIIENNVLSENHDGIHQYGCSNNEFRNNLILNNEFTGVYLDSYSIENIVSTNQILNNKWGIAMAFSCDNNFISKNNIANNSRFGVSIDSSINNMFVHNNFINNSINARITNDKNNNWDNGVEGNYWDNYSGVDENGDGIGDTSYNIPAGGWYDEIPSIYNFDNYPLMNPVNISSEK